MRGEGVKIKVGDVVLALIILAAAGLIFWRFAAGGEADSVTVASESGTAVYSLENDSTFEVASAGHTLTVEIKDGEARVTASDCPDKVCVHTPAIGKRKGAIVCVPARVQITAEGGREDEIDWTAP